MPNQIKRDPLENPQIGDMVKLRDGKFRRVINRSENNIFYLDHNNKRQKCWIITWIEWGRRADVIS